MKSAIVTGAAKGLGKEIALALTADGYAVAINYNKSRKRAGETLRKLRMLNPKCIAIQGDLTKEKNVNRLIASVIKKFGRIDVLVNNIGDFHYKPILETKVQEIEQVFQNNVSTAFMCSKAALEHMKNGRILNIGSVGCDETLAPKMTTPYYMAKTALWQLTKTMARATKKATVNMVSLGILKSSVVKKKGATYTEIGEVVAGIRKIIKSKKTGTITTIARWRPEG